MREQELTIYDVPITLLTAILRQLEDCRDLANAACVNRDWRDACNEAWENAYKALCRLTSTPRVAASALGQASRCTIPSLVNDPDAFKERMTRHLNSKDPNSEPPSFKYLANRRAAVNHRWVACSDSWVGPATGRPVMMKFDDYVRSVQLRGDAVYTCVGSSNRMECIVHVANTETNSEISLSCGSAPMWSMDVSDDGSLVATGNDDGIVALWDIQNKTSMCLNFSKRVGMQSTVQAVAMDEQHNVLFAGGINGSIFVNLQACKDAMIPVEEEDFGDNNFLWRAQQRDCCNIPLYFSNRTAFMALVHEGIICTAHSEFIKVDAHKSNLDMPTLSSVRAPDMVNALCMDVQRGLCVAACADMAVYSYDIHRLTTDYRTYNDGMWLSRVEAVGWDADMGHYNLDVPAILLEGSTVVAASSAGIVVAGARDGVVHMRMEHEEKQAEVTSIVKRDHALVTSSYDGRVTLWDDRTGRVVKVIHEHDERCWALAANEQRLASAGLDGVVCVWDFC